MKKLEPILQENKDRFVMFPISQKDMWTLYKQIECKFWFADNSQFEQDIDDFHNKLNDSEREFVAFAISNLLLRFNNDQNQTQTRFMQEMQYPEARCFLGFQMMMTNIHSETYSIFAETFLQKHNASNPMMIELMNSPVFIAKTNWIKNKFVNEADFSKRLVVYSAIQRIFCASLLPVILSFKERKIMEVFTMLTSFIYTDEGLFTDFALSVYYQLTNLVPINEVKKIITETLELEQQLIKDFSALYLALGVEPDQLNKYLQYIADCIAQSLCGEFIFENQTNPYKDAVWIRSFIKIDPRNQVDSPPDKTFSLEADF